ncbi:hypothetical protein HHX47_DHR10000069 [Lentinula edodes]|nr:hypothetical protein HHX47_DHR10000069 [Lentinula edodes]
MSFVKTPKRLYDDFTDMQHLRQYSHNAPDVRFVNHNQSSYTGYGQNYDEQNSLHLPHAGTNPQTHNLYSTEFHREALPSSILHHPNVNEPWVSYPQNYHVDSTGNYRFPDYPYPSHHLVPPVDPAASRSNFRNAGPVDLDLYSGMQRTLAGSLDPSTGVFYRMPEHPRLRTAQACEKCRTRKAKCSGEHPSCKRCSNRGLVCEYAKEGRVRGPNKPKPKLPVVQEMTSPLTSEIPVPISTPVGICLTIYSTSFHVGILAVTIITLFYWLQRALFTYLFFHKFTRSYGRVALSRRSKVI